RSAAPMVTACDWSRPDRAPGATCNRRSAEDDASCDSWPTTGFETSRSEPIGGGRTPCSNSMRRGEHELGAEGAGKVRDGRAIEQPARRPEKSGAREPAVGARIDQTQPGVLHQAPRSDPVEEPVVRAVHDPAVRITESAGQEREALPVV